MTEQVESDTVYYIKTDAPINKDSVKEDDGTYLTPQNKIAPSSKDETGSKNKTVGGNENEDVQSDRIIIKLKCAVVVLMAIVLFALMALAVHLATSHPHHRQPAITTTEEPVTSQRPLIPEIEVKNVTVQNGNAFHLTHTSSIRITYCSVNTPFDEKERITRTDERNADDGFRILIHDEQDANNDVISADKGRLHLTITENLCQITVSRAMQKDNGRWNLFVGIGNDFFKRKNIIYEVSVPGDDVTEKYESKGTSSHPTSSIKDVTIKQASENTMTKLMTFSKTEILTPTTTSNHSSTFQANDGQQNSTTNGFQTTISI